MEILNELIRLIDGELHYRNSEWKSFKLKLRDSEVELLDLIQSENCSATQAAFKLFGTDEKYPGFRKLRNSLIDALMREVNQFDPYPHNYNAFQRAYYKASWQHSCFKILKGLEQKTATVFLAENLLTRALDYDLTDIALDVSRYLSRYYSTFQIDNRRALKMHRISKEMLKAVELELECEWYYAKIFAYFGNQKGHRKDALLTAKEGYSNLGKHKPEIRSYKYHLYYFYVHLYYFELQSDYHNTVEIALRAYKHFDSLPYDHLVAKQIFLRNIASSFLRTGQYNQAQEYTEILLDVSRPGRSNWFADCEAAFLVYLYDEKYKKAFDLLNEVVAHKNLKNESQHRQNQWKQFELYIYFLQSLERLSVPKRISRRKTTMYFRELGEFDLDAEGMKIPYVIVQLLFAIVDLDYDSMEARLYSLKNYCSKYLISSSPNYRSNCFIKMLLCIPICNFHPEAIHRKAQRYVKKLNEIPIHESKQPLEVEIIPFNHLWEMIIGHLKAPKRARKNQMEKTIFQEYL